MPSMTLTCAICNEPMQKSRTSRPQGEAVHAKCKPSHGRAGTYDNGCRCDECKGWQRRRFQEYNDKVKARDGVSKTTQHKRKAIGRDPMESVDCVVCDKPLSRVRSERHLTPTHKACRIGAAFYVPGSVRIAIYERDEWTCTICAHPVESESHYLSDWYPTLDHVVPQSAQLTPDHSPGNLRLTHRYCNLARGNRSTTDEKVAQRANERRMATA